MKKLKDQLSHEELALVTGGSSTTGILSSGKPNDGNVIKSNKCTSCTGGCSSTCYDGCSMGCYDTSYAPIK